MSPEPSIQSAEPLMVERVSGAGQPVTQTFLEKHGISPILFALISLLLVFLLYQGLGGVVTVVLFGLSVDQQQVTGLRVVTLVGQIVCILLPTLVLVGLATKNKQRFLRLRRPRVLELFVPLVGIFSLQQMLQVYMVVQERIPLPESVRPVVEQLKELIEQTYRLLISSSSIPELLFVVLVIALVPAIAEEFLFRGMIQRSFEQALGSRKGFILTALIFALYHLNPFSLVPLVALGLYLGFLVYRSNTIWTSVAAHFYNNSLACVAVYLGVDENYIVTGNPEALSLIMLLSTFVVFSVVFFLSTYYFTRITTSSP